MSQYDAIADLYQESKRLPFRTAIERYTLFEALGDIRGMTVLDLACGAGHYTRLLKQAGAREVTGVDESPEMIRLARREEEREPLGCAYLCRDVADLEPPAGAADRVAAMYLLHYARSREKLVRFCRVCHAALRPGGRFVGFNDNVLSPPRGTVSYRKYGLERTGPADPHEGAPIRYRITNEDGAQFEFNNYFLKPQAYDEAFDEVGFRDFRWLGVSLEPGERGNPFWDDFLRDPPVIAFSATK
ncbi:MAG: class I SAM-dependent methyltransferase [Acidobacteria bacterium]|nr:class I SAM-dependent methyltransferase [Acidobacteriota bacterium]